MFQDYALFPHRSVAANVAFGLRMQAMPKAEVQQRTEEVLDQVGLAFLGSSVFETISLSMLKAGKAGRKPSHRR